MIERKGGFVDCQHKESDGYCCGCSVDSAGQGLDHSTDENGERDEMPKDFAQLATFVFDLQR